MKDHLFKEGNSGRPKGATNKTTKLVKETFAEVFNELQSDPEAKLSEWGKKNPTEFYKLASKLIPVQVAGDPENPLTFTLKDALGFNDNTEQKV